jgi:diguanylate cyclase (GGDEF)-like protein
MRTVTMRAVLVAPYVAATGLLSYVATLPLAGSAWRWPATGVVQAAAAAAVCHMTVRAAAERGPAERLHFETRLDHALDACRHEADVFEVVQRATESLGATASAELLLVAPDGQITQVMESGPDGEGPGCPVSRGEDCEAIRTGRARRYPHSFDFDACPQLRERLSGPCAATCVPLTVLGETIGVLHRTSSLERPVDDVTLTMLESLTAKSSARLSLMRSRRTAARSAIDPLTGVLSRAATEARMVDLARNLVPFALAQGDIDHFSDYARRHGPATATRALQMLARTLEDALRPGDLIGRLGDDELVVVLPHASDGEGQRALERVRERLVLDFVEQGLPPFTVSFGVVQSSLGRTFEELLVAADVAVSLAKDLGRNRVVVATEQLIDPRADDGLDV